MKIGRGVSELCRVENLPLPLTWPMAYTTACTTVQAVMLQHNSTNIRLARFNTFYFVVFKQQQQNFFNNLTSLTWPNLRTRLWAATKSTGSRQKQNDKKLARIDAICANLFKLVEWYVHQSTSAKHFEHQIAEVSANRLHQPQRSLYRVLGAADLLKVRKYYDERAADSLQFRRRQQVVQRKVLHQHVVIGHHHQRRLQTCYTTTGFANTYSWDVTCQILAPYPQDYKNSSRSQPFLRFSPSVVVSKKNLRTNFWTASVRQEVSLKTD